MAQNKKDINTDNFNEWLRSTGFLLPANELELRRFEKLHCTFDHELNGSVIDPTSIFNGTKPKPLPKHIDGHQVDEFSNFKMVARNGSNLPPHILAKMQQNQDKNKNDNGPKEKKVE
jgi:hypothetical protein